MTGKTSIIIFFFKPKSFGSSESLIKRSLKTNFNLSDCNSVYEHLSQVETLNGIFSWTIYSRPHFPKNFNFRISDIWNPNIILSVYYSCRRIDWIQFWIICANSEIFLFFFDEFQWLHSINCFLLSSFIDSLLQIVFFWNPFIKFLNFIRKTFSFLWNISNRGFLVSFLLTKCFTFCCNSLLE